MPLMVAQGLVCSCAKIADVPQHMVTAQANQAVLTRQKAMHSGSFASTTAGNHKGMLKGDTRAAVAAMYGANALMHPEHIMRLLGVCARASKTEGSS